MMAHFMFEYVRIRYLAGVHEAMFLGRVSGHSLPAFDLHRPLVRVVAVTGRLPENKSE